MPVPAVAAEAARRAAAKAAERSPTVRRVRPWIFALPLCAALLPPLLVVAMVFSTAVGPAKKATSRPGGRSSSVPGIDAVVLSAYDRAASTSRDRGCAMRWSIIAGIWKIESGHATYGGARADPITGDVSPPIRGPDTPYGNAMGPAQFIPSSWDIYGEDGNGDGIANPDNVFDAALATANHLCRGHDLSTEEGLREALYGYNHSWDYVDDVLGEIHGYDALGTGTELIAGSGSGADLVTVEGDSCRSLSDALILERDPCFDLANGMVDSRLVGAIVGIIAHHSIHVYVAKTGHSEYVAGTDRVSNHYACDGCPGRAMDIGQVDGEWVSDQGPVIVAFVQDLTDNHAALGIDEVGQPFASMVMSDGQFRVFSDGSHQDHVHIGIDG